MICLKLSTPGARGFWSYLIIDPFGPNRARQQKKPSEIPSRVLVNPNHFSTLFPVTGLGALTMNIGLSTKYVKRHFILLSCAIITEKFLLPGRLQFFAIQRNSRHGIISAVLVIARMRVPLPEFYPSRWNRPVQGWYDLLQRFPIKCSDGLAGIMQLLFTERI